MVANLENHSIHLASIAREASANPSQGHYFWLYKHLYESQLSAGKPHGLTIGPLAEKTEFIFPLFSTSARRNFWSSPVDWVRLKPIHLNQTVTALNKKGVTHFQFYDGGFSELLLALYLASKNPGIKFLYNFHWAIDWIELFEGTSSIAMKISATIQSALTSRPDNLHLSAETARLADKLSGYLGFTPHVYPIYASFDFRKVRAWDTRQIDVLLMPQRSHELDFSLRMAEEISRADLTARILVSRSVWDKSGNSLSGNTLASGQILFSPLGEGAYQDILGSSKVVVLPYDKPYFRWGSSGKFNESIAMGAFPMVPEETAIAGQSSYKEASHHFRLGSISEAVKSVQMRLASGFPVGLRAVEISDFWDWLQNLDVNSPRTLEDGRNVRVWTLALMAFFVPKRLARLSLDIRKFAGARFDSLWEGSKN